MRLQGQDLKIRSSQVSAFMKIKMKMIRIGIIFLTFFSDSSLRFVKHLGLEIVR